MPVGSVSPWLGESLSEEPEGRSPESEALTSEAIVGDPVVASAEDGSQLGHVSRPSAAVVVIITSTYLSTTRGRYRHLFFLLLKDYDQEQREFSNALRASLERFARQLQSEGALVRPFTGDVEATRRQVLDKRWTRSARREIRSTPSLLMIDHDFDTFDPEEHRWLQVKIPLRGREEETGRMLEDLARLITSEPEEDVFRRAHRIVRRASLDLGGIVEIRPSVFGVSLNLEGLRDSVQQLVGSRRGRSANY